MNASELQLQITSFPRLFPQRKGGERKDLGTSLAWKQVLTKKFLIPSSYLSPPHAQRLPLGIPGKKKSNNRKIESARGTMERGKRPALSSLFPLPIVLRSFSFSSPDSQRGFLPECRKDSAQIK